MYKIEYALPCYTAQQCSHSGCNKMQPMFITSKTALHFVLPSVGIKTGQKMPHPNDIFPLTQCNRLAPPMRLQIQEKSMYIEPVYYSPAKFWLINEPLCRATILQHGFDGTPPPELGHSTHTHRRHPQSPSGRGQHSVVGRLLNLVRYQILRVCLFAPVDDVLGVREAPHAWPPND